MELLATMQKIEIPGVTTLGRLFHKKIGYSARDYVQNGLICIWDAKDNKDWGVHDQDFVGLTELISKTPTMAVDTLGDDRASLKVNFGYNLSFGDRPGEVTIEFCGVKNSAKCLAQGNPSFNPIFAATSNAYGYYGGAAFSTSATSVGSGFRAWNDALTRRETVRISVKGGTTTISVGDGTERRLIEAGYGAVSKIGFCTGALTTSLENVFHCTRVYNRVLTDAEISANYAVDKARFNLEG